MVQATAPHFIVLPSVNSGSPFDDLLTDLPHTLPGAKVKQRPAPLLRSGAELLEPSRVDEGKDSAREGVHLCITHLSDLLSQVHKADFVFHDVTPQGMQRLFAKNLASRRDGGNIPQASKKVSASSSLYYLCRKS